MVVCLSGSKRGGGAGKPGFGAPRLPSRAETEAIFGRHLAPVVAHGLSEAAKASGNRSGEAQTPSSAGSLNSPTVGPTRRRGGGGGGGEARFEQGATAALPLPEETNDPLLKEALLEIEPADPDVAALLSGTGGMEAEVDVAAEIFGIKARAASEALEKAAAVTNARLGVLFSLGAIKAKWWNLTRILVHRELKSELGELVHNLSFMPSAARARGLAPVVDEHKRRATAVSAVGGTGTQGVTLDAVYGMGRKLGSAGLWELVERGITIRRQRAGPGRRSYGVEVNLSGDAANLSRAERDSQNMTSVQFEVTEASILSGKARSLNLAVSLLFNKHDHRNELEEQAGGKPCFWRELPTPRNLGIQLVEVHLGAHPPLGWAGEEKKKRWRPWTTFSQICWFGYNGVIRGNWEALEDGEDELDEALSDKFFVHDKELRALVGSLARLKNFGQDGIVDCLTGPEPRSFDAPTEAESLDHVVSASGLEILRGCSWEAHKARVVACLERSHKCIVDEVFDDENHGSLIEIRRRAGEKLGLRFCAVATLGGCLVIWHTDADDGNRPGVGDVLISVGGEQSAPSSSLVDSAPRDLLRKVLAENEEKEVVFIFKRFIEANDEFQKKIADADLIRISPDDFMLKRAEALAQSGAAEAAASTPTKLQLAAELKLLHAVNRTIPVTVKRVAADLKFILAILNMSVAHHKNLVGNNKVSQALAELVDQDGGRVYFVPWGASLQQQGEAAKGMTQAEVKRAFGKSDDPGRSLFPFDQQFHVHELFHKLITLLGVFFKKGAFAVMAAGGAVSLTSARWQNVLGVRGISSFIDGTTEKLAGKGSRMTELLQRAAENVTNGGTGLFDEAHSSHPCWSAQVDRWRDTILLLQASRFPWLATFQQLNSLLPSITASLLVVDEIMDVAAYTGVGTLSTTNAFICFYEEVKDAVAHGRSTDCLSSLTQETVHVDHFEGKLNQMFGGFQGVTNGLFQTLMRPNVAFEASEGEARLNAHAEAQRSLQRGIQRHRKDLERVGYRVPLPGPFPYGPNSKPEAKEGSLFEGQTQHFSENDATQQGPGAGAGAGNDTPLEESSEEEEEEESDVESQECNSNDEEESLQRPHAAGATVGEQQTAGEVGNLAGEASSDEDGESGIGAAYR